MASFVGRVQRLIQTLHEEGLLVAIGGDDCNLAHSMSQELAGHKGRYVVFAGVFSEWTFGYASIFAQRLSEEFGTDVMLMCWDHENWTVQCQVYEEGRELLERPLAGAINDD